MVVAEVLAFAAGAVVVALTLGSASRVLLGLARLTMAPPAPWSSDRVGSGNYTPPILRRRVRS